MRLYPHFSLDMDRSPGFGSMATDFVRPVQTRFPCASDTECLKLASYYNSPDRSTKSTIPLFNELYLLVSTRFQVLFHSPPGVLFTFPSRYCFSIGHQVVFWLGWWSTRLPTGFHVPRGTLDPVHSLPPSSTGFSPSVIGLPMPFDWLSLDSDRPQPRRYCYLRFGLFRVRSPLLTESRLITLPRPT